MNYREKLVYVKAFVEENIDSVEQFCAFFDVTLDDMVGAFTDKMVKNYGKVCGDSEEDDQDEFEGFSIIDGD